MTTVVMEEASPARADTGGYPYANEPCEHSPYATSGTGYWCSHFDWGPVHTEAYNDPSEISQYGYAFRNCTDYVAWEISSVLGVSLPHNWGNASNWATAAQNDNYKFDNTPQVGDIAQWISHDHVAYVYAVNNGVASFYEYNANEDGTFTSNYTSVNNPAGVAPDHYIHIKDMPSGGGISSLPDGTYISASDTGRVYVMAGGAPMYVSSWSNVGGQHAISYTYTQSQIDAAPTYPRDGTAIRNYVNGSIYIVAGGFAFAVTSLNNVPPLSWTNVDGYAISTQLLSQPLDGTVVRNYGNGGIYVVSGDAAMAVTSLSNIPYTSWTNVDGWSISNQLRQYPLDGTDMLDYKTGTVYIAAGESALAVSSFSNIPPVTSMADVDDWAIHNQLRQYPLDGTVIRGYTTGAGYVVAGGAATDVANWSNIPYSGYINVDQWAINNQLLAYPMDGTYVRGYGSGDEFEAMSGALTRITSTPLPAATYIDDWAIVNQLGGVE